jgi:acylphosphatase
MPAIHVLVSGKVQGVFYRKHTQQTGQALGLTGWVRNLDDGRVEILAEGDAEALKNLVAWCGKGSPKARVENVEVDEVEPSNGFSAFEVRR